MRWRRALSPSLLLAAVVGVVSCAGPAEEMGGGEPIVDLAAIFPFTEHRPSTRRIDLSQPRDLASLGGGWTEPSTLADGTGGRSNAASVTRVSFDGGHDPTPLRVALRARVDLPPTRGARQERSLSTVRIRINNALAATVVVSGELQTHAFDVPRELLRPGRNEMTLKHIGTIDPRGSRPRRGSTFFYESIVFEPTTPVSPGPHLAQDESRLVLPPGAEAPFFFRVPAGAELRLSVEPPEALSVLGVSVEADGFSAHRLTLRGHPEARAAIPLPEGSLARLAFGVPSDGPQATLVRPTVWGRQETAPGAVAPALPAGKEANIILLYIVDTLRADRLGCYGYPRSTSPAIDRLAREGVLFERAIAQSSWTRPAVASILTGAYPVRHGAITLENAIASGVPSLAEMLRAAGYYTAGFVTNVNVGDRFGFGRGFDVYRYLPEDVSRTGIHVPAAALQADMLAWLGRHAGERVFVYLHATDPHGPYTPSPETATRLGNPHDGSVTDPLVRQGVLPRSPATTADAAYLSGLYDAEIAELDAAIGQLRDAFERLGLLERTIFVLIGDHGEEFLEHGALGHGHTLYDEQLHVPFIVRLPGAARAGTRIARSVRQVDVLPTLLGLVGVHPPPSSAGVPLLGPGAEPTMQVSETVAETRLAGQGVAALVDDDWKAILRAEDGRVELYDRRRDPGERRDLAGAHPIRVGYARQRLLQLTMAHASEPGAAPAAPQLDSGTIQRLRALGYLH